MKLKEKGIGIIFEEENINTLEMAGELLLTILSSVAQQESETISNHVKLGLKMKMERGEIVGFNRCLGYNYDPVTKKIYIYDNIGRPLVEECDNPVLLEFDSKQRYNSFDLGDQLRIEKRLTILLE